MLSLGLDPSLTGFGWCVHDSDAAGEARVISRGVFKTTSKQIFVERYIQLRESVKALLDRYPDVRVIGVESPPFGEQYSEGLYALFLYVNEAIYTRRRDVVYFDPVTVKMLVKLNPKLVKGPMGKGDMIRLAREDTSVKKWNHNEADAYHIARFAARFFEFLGEEIEFEDLTPAEQHSFARERTFVRGKKKGLTEKKGLIFREKDRYFQFSKVPLEST
jgi:Holliday junction resolvasome RuvABC endonuclease subunit